jgi:5-hydroxyisourate hydrolase
MITTHVLDITRGRPAAGLPIHLAVRSADGWMMIAKSGTDEEGRCRDLVPDDVRLKRGTYRLTFDTGAYFRSQRLDAFYPVVEIVFEVPDPSQHYHVPLLLSPYGYSTYRGS